MATASLAGAQSFYDGEVLLRMVASAVVQLSKQRQVPHPVYGGKVQNAYNHLVLRCLKRREEPPGSVVEMVRWAAERPLSSWPVAVPEGLAPQEGYLVDRVTLTPTQLCLEWGVSVADPAAELFENALIAEAMEVCRAAQSPQAYTAFRRLLTERPVLTGAGRARLGGNVWLGLLNAVIKRCYEPAPAAYQRNGVFHTCSRCRCLLVPVDGGQLRCELDRCRSLSADAGEPVDPRQGGVFQLSRPLRMFITGPGLAETDLETRLKKRQITPEMWPNFDTYDLRVPLPGNRFWAVDVKDRVNPVLLARTMRAFRADPPFDKAFVVVPRYRFQENEAYGRLFARNLPEGLTGRMTLVDDQRFLRLVDAELRRKEDADA